MKKKKKKADGERGQGRKERRRCEAELRMSAAVEKEISFEQKVMGLFGWLLGSRVGGGYAYYV